MLARKSMESSVTGGWRELGMAERMPQGGLPLVLLAGDGQEGTRWLRVLLEGGGYAVLQERTAQHALERARTTEPDVILVDAELPDMAGVELCRMLRTDSRISSSTPILLTIRDAATRVQRLAALRAGAWECIAPPHDADEILLKIGAYVHAKLDADRARAGGLLDPVTGLYNRQGLARRARGLGLGGGWGAGAKVGWARMERVDLLVRAAAAVRTGKPDSATWLRRFDEAATPPSSPA